MEAQKQIERIDEGEYRTIKLHVVKENIIDKKIFDDIVDWVGEAVDYEHTIYLTIGESSFFDVDDVILWLEENIIDDFQEREDYEIERAKDYIKVLTKWKGYTIYGD